jgi:tRNA-2-methylthio-N6-dimethylallyladenosine synthase
MIKMQTIRRVFQVDRKDINYLRTTLESYDGMAVVRTLDSCEACVEVEIAPGCETLFLDLINSLKEEEGLELSNRSKNLSKAFYITTMGCQMNEYDSDLLARSLITAGFSQTNDPFYADLVLINTCTVRAKPEQKAFSLLGRMSAIKRRRPELILGIIGCLAQQYGAQLLKRFPLLDLVMGPRELGGLVEAVQRLHRHREKVVATGLDSVPPGPFSCRGYLHGRVTGYISIMEGCDNFCSYCIVPFVRGREISRPPNEILTQASGLIAEGIKEVTLLGQNVNSYTWKRDNERWGFVRLLKALDSMEGLWRLRFTTSHPKDLSDDLIRAFGELDTLCPHIHLPFQAGSNRVLTRMRRGYTREQYMHLVDKLRFVAPYMAITSDVMVGFPGESEKDFEMTLDLIKRVQFDSLFSFKYSDRKGTFAEKMGQKVAEAEKSIRLSALQSLQRRITLAKNQALEGSGLEVLVEGHGKREGQMMGRTGTNKIVNFRGDDSLQGNFVTVRITQGRLNSLRGKLL